MSSSPTVNLSHVYSPVRTLRSARYVFLHDKSGLGRCDFKKLWGLTQVFQRWVGEDCYLCAVVFDEEEGVAKVQFWPAKKRGNKAYTKAVKRRVFGSVPRSCDLKKNMFASNGSANILHITLTVNPKRCLGDVNRAWRQISKEYNKFITAFRRRYGQCWVLRSFEAQRNGYPHVHLFVISEHSFDAKWHVSKKKGNSRWIVEETKKKHIAPQLGVEVDGFENLWRFGFVNCRAVGTHPKFRDTVKIQNYIMKDVISSVMKEVEDLQKSNAEQVFDLDFDKVSQEDKNKWNALLTYALAWLFRKHAFAISGKEMFEGVFDLIWESVSQTGAFDFSGLRGVFEWRRYRFLEFIGIVHLIRPPPTEPVAMIWDEIDELKRLAIGYHCGGVDFDY